MSWEAFVEGFQTFWNQPVPIIGFSIGTTAIFVFGILSKTTIGKKTLNYLKNGYDKAKLSFEEAMKKKDEIIEEIKAEKETIKQEYENAKIEIKNQYEEKLVIVQEEKQKLEDLVLAISENIHNHKIQDLVNEYLETAKTEVMEINDVVKDEVNNIVEEYKNEVANLKAEIESLRHEIENESNEVADDINEVVDSVETEINDIVEEVEDEAKEIANTVEEVLP